MKMSSRGAKVAALATALAAHGALAVATSTPEETLIEGAAGAGELRLGNAFADMVAGTLGPEASEAGPTPAETPEPIEAARPETVPPETPDRAEPAPPEVTEQARTAPAEQAPPPVRTPTPVPDRATAPPAEPAEAPSPETAQPAPALAPAEVVVAAPSDSAAPEEPPEVLTAQPASAAQPEPLTAEPARPLEAARPVAPAEPAPKEPAALTGAEPDSAAVARSLRPMRRSEAFEARHKPPPAAKKPVRQAAPKKAPAGNGNQNARAGAATGSETATARRSGSAGRSSAAGNAAASNYPGQVMAKLSRAGRPRVNARGTAVVAFTISSGGGIARVGLARSSGSAALDRAAVQIVRRAAPFPAPPAGARRSFSINIQGR